MKNAIKQHVVEIPAGKRIAKIIFEDIPKLPKDFLDIESLEGYWIASDSIIIHIPAEIASESSKNIFSELDEAEAAIAMAQLTQLKKVYNGGWTPDYEKYNQPKYCIEFCQASTELVINTNYKTRKFLAFKTLALAEEFLENFKSLIVQTRPLV